MMEDKDLEEYHNIGKPIKFHNKYKYIQGKQLTDPGTGTRVYDIDNYRLPSVTTILGATKNQQFIKDWKAEVGEKIIMLHTKEIVKMPLMHLRNRKKKRMKYFGNVMMTFANLFLKRPMSQCYAIRKQRQMT